ncbi:MAG: CDP-alcohol phosphatidyltransferase [Marmoricola sp.]|nr:CDP-alcohol phosphatidyltransferase [Marmoricola sp.]
MRQVQRRANELATPANLVTGSRVVLAAVVGGTALVDGPRWLLGVLIAAALLTDFADGRLARATGTTTRYGARLDQEADAFLILVLSAVVAAHLHAWVLGIGLARYVFGALFALVPPLRTPPASPRTWCKTVAALVGVVLATEVVLPLPDLVATIAAGVVAVLLAESFLHEALDRWRAPGPALALPAATVLSFVAVWLVLVAPGSHAGLSARALLQLPVELLGIVVLALVPWRRLRVGLAAVAGLLLAALLLVKVLDIGFEIVFARGFDPGGDWAYLGPAVGVLGDSIGTGAAKVVAGLIGVATLALLVGLPLAVIRLTGVAARNRRPALTAAVVFGCVWGVALATGLQALAGAPVASATIAALTVDEAHLLRADVVDSRRFGRQIGSDPHGQAAAAAPQTLLSGLAGKDVLVVFVESYGRVAVQGTSYSKGIDQVIDQGTTQLAAAGYQTRSAFLTSPTFGAGSWLAHSTLESGLWVNSERRYGQLLTAKRDTLTSLFGEAGWHTVFDVPADTRNWSQGQHFYGFQQYYDDHNVGYRGPKFGYAPIPDQYTLEQFRRDQLAPAHRKPVFAEIDLVSSHHPWTPLPHLVPWDQLGDGSLYDDVSQKPDAAQVFKSTAKVKKMYGESIEYSWQALTSFLTTYDDPNLVVIALGDHQPHSYVSGEHAGHDVPISVIAQDPDVMKRIAGWGWQSGLRPSPDAGVWRMDAFRNKFLAAFGG